MYRIAHEKPKEEQVWYRWSRFIQHRPGWSAAVAVGFLLLLTIPLFSIRLGFGDAGNYPEDQTVRRAYDMLAEGFGPGTNGPLFITVQGDTASDPEALGAFVETLNATENVAFSLPNQISDDLASSSCTRRARRRTRPPRRSSTTCATT